MAIPRNPKSLKILKNCVPEASLRALLKKTPKMIEKVIFPGGWICNPYTPVQSKHTFSFSRFGQKSDPKSLPKWNLGAPKITKNQEKRVFKKTVKIGCKKYQK
jgi:hypothetical protein